VLELTGVDPCPHGDACVLGFATDRLGAPNSLHGTVEHAEGAVAGHGHQTAAGGFDHETHRAFVINAKLSIRSISDTFKQLG
jgi:hypothetical protein